MYVPEAMLKGFIFVKLCTFLKKHSHIYMVVYVYTPNERNAEWNAEMIIEGEYERT